jgi:murein L,D-transpeptidase YafK
MMIYLRKLVPAMLVLGLLATLAACGGLIEDGKANAPLSAEVRARLAAMGSSPGEAMMVRIFKQSSEFEVWKHTSSGQFKLFQTYKICSWSGGLGPKIVEGDRQSPEGFYTITPALMNPKSNYYLAFNTGFPNKFDRAYGRNGSNLMVHGDCSSSGCYAMTDSEIAEIYALARESFRGGNPSFQLQIFPFRMTPQNLAKESGNSNMSFWKNIKTGYDQFELTKSPPTWDVCDKKYVFNASRADGQPLDPVAACPVLTADAALLTQLQAKQIADDAAIAAEAVALSEKQAKDAAAAQKAADEAAAVKARGDAIGGAVGGFFGGIFGGKPAVAAPVVVDPKAPVPKPRIVRS